MRVLCAVLFSAAVSLAGENLGRPLTLKKQTRIAEINASPDKFAGRVVQVKGRITEVCENMGCWMNLVDGDQKIRIKVKDGEIVFPKTAVGKTAIAEGALNKIEMTKEQAIAQARHEAEENKKKFDPASITGPVTIYQIQGTGAVILD